MRNKEFQKLLKKNKSKSNSGFTLTELLVGLVMSTIVVSGLGWGLMQMLTTTQRETSRVNSRNETSRAFNFIADEVKAAQAIEVDTSLSNINNNDRTDNNGVAANYPPRTDDADGTITGTANSSIPPVLALQIPGVTQRVVYSVAPPQTNTWKGPLVIYRWGPNLKADGSYSDPTNVDEWKNEALIDGVSDVAQTAICDADGDGTDDTVTYLGFYACVEDNDNDGVAEDAPDTNGDGTINANDTGASDLNGDGVIDNGDRADDDGTSITAQLYFAADTDSGVYKADSQVVARARVAPLRKPGLSATKLLEFESLNDNYGRNKNDDPNTPCWTVRNDFGQGDDPTARPGSGDELTNVMTWIHEDNRRPQPLNIDTSQPLTIVASAFGGLNSDCLARGNKHKREWDSSHNEYRYVDSAGNTIDPNTDDGSQRVAADGTEQLHTYEHKVWHTIDFSDHDTFNGEDSSLGADVTSSNSNPRGDDTVKIFKDGDRIDSSADYQGYDADDTANDDGTRDQSSLEAFLQSKGYVNNSGEVVLEPNQRIIAFEIGQDVAGTDASPNPGFDLQDSIFIITSDAFAP